MHCSELWLCELSASKLATRCTPASLAEAQQSWLVFEFTKSAIVSFLVPHSEAWNPQKGSHHSRVSYYISFKQSAEKQAFRHALHVAEWHPFLAEDRSLSSRSCLNDPIYSMTSAVMQGIYLISYRVIEHPISMSIITNHLFCNSPCTLDYEQHQFSSLDTAA